MSSRGRTVFQSQKRLYICKFLFICPSVCLKAKSQNSLKSILLHHPSFILQLLSFPACFKSHLHRSCWMTSYMEYFGTWWTMDFSKNLKQDTILLNSMYIIFQLNIFHTWMYTFSKWQLEFWQRRGVSDVNTAHSAVLTLKCTDLWKYDISE